MNALAIAAMTAIYVFDLGNNAIKVDPKVPTFVQLGKIQVHFDEQAPTDIQVVDSVGRTISVGVEVLGKSATVKLKAWDVRGFPCGPMKVFAQGEERTILIRPHHANVCEPDHQH